MKFMTSGYIFLDSSFYAVFKKYNIDKVMMRDIHSKS